MSYLDRYFEGFDQKNEDIHDHCCQNDIVKCYVFKELSWLHVNFLHFGRFLYQNALSKSIKRAEAKLLLVEYI